jgi:hypothetical protein
MKQNSIFNSIIQINPVITTNAAAVTSPPLLHLLPISKRKASPRSSSSTSNNSTRQQDQQQQHREDEDDLNAKATFACWDEIKQRESEYATLSELGHFRRVAPVKNTQGGGVDVNEVDSVYSVLPIFEYNVYDSANNANKRNTKFTHVQPDQRQQQHALKMRRTNHSKRLPTSQIGKGNKLTSSSSSSNVNDSAAASNLIVLTPPPPPISLPTISTITDPAKDKKQLKAMDNSDMQLQMAKGMIKVMNDHHLDLSLIKSNAAALLDRKDDVDNTPSCDISGGYHLGPTIVDEREANEICQSCGTILQDRMNIVVDYKERVNTCQMYIEGVSKLTGRKTRRRIGSSAYNPEVNYALFIQRKQGKETRVPEDVITIVKMDMSQYEISCDELTEALLIIILRRRGLAIFYNNRAQIMHRITGKEPMQFDLDHVYILCKRFKEFVSVWPYIKGDRRSLPRYNITSHLVCEMEGLTQYLSVFPFIKNKDKLNDQISEYFTKASKILKPYGWKYIAPISDSLL